MDRVIKVYETQSSFFLKEIKFLKLKLNSEINFWKFLKLKNIWDILLANV